MGVGQVDIAPVKAAKIRVPPPSAYLRGMANTAPSIPRVGIIGSGSWATALTFLFTQHEDAVTHPVHWWIRQPEALDHIRETGHNPHYLQSLTLDRDRLALHGDVQAVVEASDLVVLCVPSAYLDDALQGVTGLDDKVVFNAIKGFITDDHHIPARYLHKVFGVPYDRIGLISGPSHAEEVARKNWTYLTLACPDVPLAKAVADRVRNPWLRTETTDDLFGIELAAVLKNVYAVAAGIAHGLGLGDNFIAVMMANAMQETRRFLDAVNETSRDVNASAYMGDLIVTAYSPHSRNRRLGTMIGRGYRVLGALIEMDMVAEGYPAAKGIHEINQKFGVSMPVAECVYRVLHDNIAPAIEMRILADNIH